LLIQQSIQHQALKIASSNLTSHSNSICESFDLYNIQAQKEFVKQSLLLTSFPHDLETLKKLKVHPIINNQNKCLVDFVPLEKILNWVDKCRASYDELLSKTDQISKSIHLIRSQSSPLANIGLDLTKLENNMNTVNSSLQIISTLSSIIVRDFKQVQQYSNDSNRLTDLLKTHLDEYFPSLRSHDRILRENVITFSDSKVKAFNIR
jgi:hypothetical protein